MPGNGSSYQKDGVQYEPIATNANGGESGSSTKKWVIGAVVAIILLAIGKSTFYKTPGAATDAAVAKANLPKSKTGKLKLFDEHRKCSGKQYLPISEIISSEVRSWLTDVHLRSLESQ